MNKASLGLLILPLLFSCGGNKVYIELPYSETPTVRDVTNAQFKAMIDAQASFISYITFSDLVDCDCSNSESRLKEYLNENHYDAYRIVFDAESSDFEATYNELVEITGEESKEMAIPELIIEDGKIIIPLYPRMLLVSEGLIALNTDSSFTSALSRYVSHINAD